RGALAHPAGRFHRFQGDRRFHRPELVGMARWLASADCHRIERGLAKSDQFDPGPRMTAGRTRRPARRHAPTLVNAPFTGAAIPPEAGKTQRAANRSESNKISTDISIGKYVVCPIAKPLA